MAVKRCHAPESRALTPASRPEEVDPGPPLFPLLNTTLESFTIFIPRAAQAICGGVASAIPRRSHDTAPAEPVIAVKAMVSHEEYAQWILVGTSGGGRVQLWLRTGTDGGRQR